MKTQILITFLAVFVYLSANAVPTISIKKKNTGDPTDVCNNTTLSYVTTISGAPSGYKVRWLKTHANIDGQSTSEANVTWTANSDVDGYIGTIQAQLLNANDNLLATSNTITVTIKSILHLEPTLTPVVNGSTYNISPCSQGQISLEVTKLEIPGTGTFPIKIYNYVWILPAGWSANGVTSNGSNEIYGGSYITATYPASSTGGTIKVKGYEAITGCDATAQSSKFATATINRNVTLALTANKSYFLCGDTNPITYTVTANPALPCALYYWNNSPASTTSNTFQKVPGLGNETVTVTIIYGTQSVTKTITVPVKSFEGISYIISGSDNICAGYPQTYTIVPELPTGYTASWSCSSNLHKLSENNNNVGFEMLSAGTGTVYATITTPCGESLSLAKPTWAGKPVINTISGPQNLPYGGNQIYTADVSGANGATYQWTVSPSLPLTSYGDNVQISFPSTNGDYVITLVVTGCGPTAPYYFYVATGEYEVNIIYPNPASGETTLSLASALPANELDDLQEWEYEIYSQNQSLKEKKTKLKGKTTKINTSDWKEGVYIVRVKYGKEVFQGKLIVKR